MENITTVTVQPPAVGTAQTFPFATIAKGQILVACYAQVVLPSDSGSSGLLKVGGDNYNLFNTSGLQPSADGYNPGDLATTSLLISGGFCELVPAGETLTLTWTPGGSPGVTAPMITVKLVTENLF